MTTDPKPLSRAGAEILQALTEFRDALKAGQPIEKAFTVRTVTLNLAPKEYSAGDVRATRKLLTVSQALFAQVLGVDASTVRAWEQGRKSPSPIARRFMDEIAFAPDYWRKRINQMVVSKGPNEPAGIGG